MTDNKSGVSHLQHGAEVVDQPWSRVLNSNAYMQYRDTHQATPNDTVMSHLQYGAEVLDERGSCVLKLQELQPRHLCRSDQAVGRVHAGHLEARKHARQLLRPRLWIQRAAHVMSTVLIWCLDRSATCN